MTDQSAYTTKVQFIESMSFVAIFTGKWVRGYFQDKNVSNRAASKLDHTAQHSGQATVQVGECSFQVTPI
jgi:hypothetical protein